MESLEPWLIKKEGSRPATTSGLNLAGCRIDMSTVSSATRTKCSLPATIKHLINCDLEVSLCASSEKQACFYAYPSFMIFSGPVFLMLMGAMYFSVTVLQTSFDEEHRGSFHTVWIH